jgi:hypothetical protein
MTENLIQLSIFAGIFVALLAFYGFEPPHSH